MNFKNFIITLCLVLPNLVVSQYSNLKFENFDTKEGLSSSSCLEIFEDKDGLLWIGTIDGLNKYNGYEFEIYCFVLDDLNSISNNRINVIQEDNEGNIWVGTNNGLNFLNKRTNKFSRIDLYKHLSLTNGNQKNINDLLYDEVNNHLWVATDNGVIKIVLQDDNKNVENFKFSYYINDESNSNSIDNNNVNNILMDKTDQSVWVGTNGNHLNHYNAINDNFERVYIDSKKNYKLDHIKKRFFIDSDGDFWIGNDLANLVLWNKSKNTFNNVSFVEKTMPIHDFYQDKKGLFWVSTDVNGLYLFEKRSNSILQHIESNYSDPFSLPNNKPSKIFEDSNGIFWFGTHDKGVAKLDISKYPFDHYYYKPNVTNGLSAEVSQSVLQDSKGRIWISSYNKGVDLFDEKNKSFTNYTNVSGKLSSDKILYTFESKDGNIWICTLDGGVNKFNPDKNTLETFLHDVKDSLSIGQSSVWAGVEDSKNRLWFALKNEGVSLYNPKTNHFKNYKDTYRNKNNLVSNSVRCLFVDSKDRLFLGTLLGLSVVDLNTLDEFIPETINFKEVNENGIKDYGVNYITEDHLGNIWLGTDNGIFKLGNDLNLVKSYSSKNGLPNNLVVGIKEDNNYDFWITTKGGLSLLNAETHQFKNFSENDGLQGVEYQSKSIEKTKDGRIIIGGNHGFNIFHPNDINRVQETIKLKPRIKSFKLNNRLVSIGDSINGRVVLNKSIAEVQNLKLNYNENYISFEFLALHMENPKQVQYAYRMVGLDNEFIKIGNKRDVNLPNLEPGDYKFEVKASVDGKWENAESAKVEFKISPPLWKTWWAYILYFILGSLLFWIITRYYTFKVQEEQKHDLDQMKLQFFINVSHEFRTPLTLILNPVDKILSSFNNDPETIKSSALSIQRSARRLLHLVNQLLDYRKMDVGMSPLRLEKGDIVKFTEDIFSLFKDLTVKKEISYVFKTNSKVLNSVFDFDKIEKIITNLISNAIKFTNSGGEIIVSINKRKVSKGAPNYVSFKKEKLGDYIEISVKDTGIGLNKEQLRSVFSRFYNVDTTKTGTGIGLNFTKGLVELHGGEIMVESEYMKGSKFIVKIPLNIKANAEKFENFKDEFLINSMKAVEYDMLISNDEQLSKIPNNEAQVNNNSKPTILIVEDNKELRIHLINDLKDLYTIKEAVNGEEGLKMVNKHYPDIVISDVMMPKMDGFEMCKKIKTEFDTCHIPVLLLTARTLEEDRIEGYENGADSYLSKPFAINVLRTRIQNLLDAKERLKKRFSEVGGIVPSVEATTNNLDQAFLDKTTKIIIENISNVDFKQDDLLKEISMGRSQFYRKINSLTGHNPSYFIRTIRLKYAAELLIKSEHSIKEITHMCGFNSTAYFSKTFRELFNLTPTEFIEQEKDTLK